MTRLGKRARTAVCLAAAILAASAASARTERFRWTEATANVDGFTLRWGGSSGSHPLSLFVGVPPRDSTGAYYYDLVVPDADTIYMTVTATDNGLESPKSNEIRRVGITGTPPPPPPPPPPSGSAPNAPTVTASGWLVHGQPATTGAAATAAWFALYPFDSSGAALTLTDSISGGPFPRDLDLTPYFAQRIDAVRIEVQGCAQNANGSTCAARLNVLRTAVPPPQPALGAPGRPYIVP